jgi:hypothetical protein
MLLTAAYAVYEEALIVGTWFDPQYQQTVGVSSYSRVRHTGLILAAHLTAFHVAVSICSSIVVVERILPAAPRAASPPAPPDRDPRPFRTRRFAVVAFLATAVHFVLVYSLPSTGLPWPAGLPARDPWPNSNQPAILAASPRATAASRHPGT